MRSIVVAAAGAALIALPAGVAGGTAGFTPKAIAGTYKGTWANTTFNVEGTFSITFAARKKNKVLGIAAAMTGTAFGCQTAPTFPALSLTKGSGANHWDATGWRVKKSGSFGSITPRVQGGKLTRPRLGPRAAVVRPGRDLQDRRHDAVGHPLGRGDDHPAVADRHDDVQRGEELGGAAELRGFGDVA